jgi:hypothetical protein
MVKTHLIVTEQHDDYSIEWINRLLDCKPDLSGGLLHFAILSTTGRREINTMNMKEVEKIAMKSTYPRGRGALTVDKARIYIKEEDGGEKLLGVVTHKHIRKYAPMYDEC